MIANLYNVLSCVDHRRNFTLQHFVNKGTLENTVLSVFLKKCQKCTNTYNSHKIGITGADYQLINYFHMVSCNILYYDLNFFLP